MEEIAVDCVTCAEPFALDVDTEAEEQSHFVECPSCHQALEVFARCRPGEVLSISVSVD
jgi:Zn finger protein HypA/HybF involved in hydrogenase expression